MSLGFIILGSLLFYQLCEEPGMYSAVENATVALRNVTVDIFIRKYKQKLM